MRAVSSLCWIFKMWPTNSLMTFWEVASTSPLLKSGQALWLTYNQKNMIEVTLRYFFRLGQKRICRFCPVHCNTWLWSTRPKLRSLIILLPYCEEAQTTWERPHTGALLVFTVFPAELSEKKAVLLYPSEHTIHECSNMVVLSSHILE